ncbi:MAG: flagellar biosynthetic protein FliR [Desulfobacteraceae bacterium]|nr:flagellar biosynthetic protein FliR [Desulfobacteraceae bacterium]
MGLTINMVELGILLAILLRLSVILFMLPIFSSAQVPQNIKAGIIIALSMMLFPLIRQGVQPLEIEPFSIMSVVVGEVIFGVLFSLSMLLVTSAFQLAGELVGFEMGFGFAQTADPQSGTQFGVLGVWGQLFAILIFFSLNGHHVVLRLIVESFSNVPVGSFSLASNLFNKILLLSGQLFVLAVKLAAPVMAVLILAQVGMALMSKFAPQINILATSFPLTIGLGIFFFGLTMISWGDVATRAFTDLFTMLSNFTR